MQNSAKPERADPQSCGLTLNGVKENFDLTLLMDAHQRMPYGLNAKACHLNFRPFDAVSDRSSVG